MQVKIPVKDYVKMEHARLDDMGWAFIDGCCVGVLIICLAMTHFFTKLM